MLLALLASFWRKLPLKVKVGAIAGLAVLSVLMFQQFQIHRLTAHAVASDLRADSTAAALDTMKVLNKDLTYGLTILQDHVVQIAMKSDSLDKKLKQESKLRVELEGKIDGVNADVKGKTLVDSGDVRKAEFNSYLQPYHVFARVALPPYPGIPQMGIKIEMDTMDLKFRIACSSPVNGVRQALLQTQTPSWFHLKTVNSYQDKDVCMPSDGTYVAGISKKKVIGLTVLGGVAGALGAQYIHKKRSR